MKKKVHLSAFTSNWPHFRAYCGQQWLAVSARFLLLSLSLSLSLSLLIQVCKRVCGLLLSPLALPRGAFSRGLALALILSLALPLPLVGQAANATPAAAHVQARLNSPARAAAIAKALEMDKAAKAAVAAQEAEQRHGLPRQASGLPRNDNTKASALGTAQASSSVTSQGPALSAQPPAPVIARSEATRQSMPLAPSRPKSASEVLFNAATAAMGMPGLTHNGYDPYAPNTDQGLGFHADGTVRKAGGEDGTSGYNGKRAAAYAGSGLGYGPYGSMGGGMGYQEPGYDPVTRQNYRYSDPTSGGRRSMSQGGYGSMDGMDPTRLMLDRSLNYGLGLANTAAEGMFMGLSQNPYGSTKARFNFMVDWDGKVNGEGDVLFPLYDSQYTTVYTQIGTRSMNAEDSKDRWIGNFGLGQRWYPFAVNKGIGEDAGNIMLGYNAFYDHDFTRSHSRGGLGLEAQYDWIHLASNYYAPLSGWKDSEDFDGRFVQERAAEGWDLRAKGYLPFYRNVAVTGSYTQWFGDHVGMFGASRLERDPKVWSYGLEYTPISLVSGFVNQRATERGRTDTEFGLRLTYTFGQSWEDQTSHKKVAEMRTVGGSRHEFVDRENRMILEYRAKNNFHVEFVGSSGSTFTFRIKNGFGSYVAGQRVRVSASAGVTVAELQTAPASFFAQALEFLDDLISVKAAYAASSGTYTSGPDGTFRVDISGLTAASTVTIEAGNSSRTFTAAELGGGANPTGLSLAVTYNRTSFDISDFSATATVTATASKDGSSVTINSGDVTWTVESSSITAAWWGNREAKATNGLTWGASPLSLSGTDAQRIDMVGTVPTGATAQLTDIVGSRTVTLKAAMTIDGTPYTQTITVTFGNGPLSVFNGKPVGSKTWAAAATACGGTGNIDTAGYQASTKLPTMAQLQNVAGTGSGGKQGAAHAAGWPDDGNSGGWFLYWTGEANGDGLIARVVLLNDGLVLWGNATTDRPVAVCLP